jgi:hypothetical protein
VYSWFFEELNKLNLIICISKIFLEAAVAAPYSLSQMVSNYFQ